MPPPGSYAPVPFNDIGATGPVALVSSRPAVEIALPPLRFGAACLEHMPAVEAMHGLSWRDASYRSFAPVTIRLDSATLHSDAGIVLFRNSVLAQSLDHTHPERHRYAWRQGRLVPRVTERIPLAGSWASLLCGSNGNHFHALVDGFGRLAALPEPLPPDLAGLLVPAACEALLPLLRTLAPGVPLRTVAPDHTIAPEALYLPSSVHGFLAYHACLAALFDRLEPPPHTGPPPPTRFYIDRRGAAGRPLMNEAALIEALTGLGIVAIRLEELSLPAQMRLFRGAELIVAPHGAGLANILFAGPGCTVLELMMHAQLHWAFRRLAALRGMAYDCIIGHADLAPPEAPPAVWRWSLSIPHVIAAVHDLLETTT